MTIVTPSDDILVDGYSLYSFVASSAVSGGALVRIVGEYSVGHASSQSHTVGVAISETAAGNYVDVAGPGCIVRCCASGAIVYGDDLYAAATGKVDKNHTYGNPTTRCIGIALETQATAEGALKVLLK